MTEMGLSDVLSPDLITDGQILPPQQSAILTHWPSIYSTSQYTPVRSNHTDVIRKYGTRLTTGILRRGD